MMLDSALGKILTKRVGPSKSVPSEKIAKSNTTPQASSSSEAEIRLVVRLLVEEHIVFNGKVEEIKQLESEEVSRIVSRIAWDGAKEIDDSVAENKPAKVCHGEVTADLTGDQMQTSTLHDTINQSSTTSPILREVVTEKNQENEVQDTNNQSELTISKLNKHPSTDKDEPIAQVKDTLAQDEKTYSCDTHHNTKCLSHVCESINQPENSYNTIQENLNMDAHLDDLTTNQLDPFVDGQDESKRLTDYYEYQSIAETLNDCVNSVDIESRIISDQNNCNSTGVDFIQSQDNDNDGCTSLTSVRSPPSTIKIEEDADHSETDFHAKQLHQNTNDVVLAETSLATESNSLETKIDSSRGSECCKNKESGGTSLSHKRIRRVSSKDHQRKRKITDINKTSSTEEADHISLISSNSSHLARNSRIFAKWSDNHYYPGTILRPSKDRKFVVGFFDGAQRNVVETDLIPLCNIGGKQVRVSIAKNYCVNAIVHDQRSSIGDQPMFDVEYQQDGLVRKCVPLNDIFLTAEQGAPLISQPIKPEKNPDESLFAGVDLDNIVHVKRSRRLQELEDLDIRVSPTSNNGNTGPSSSRRKRGQYNMRNITQRTPRTIGTDGPCEQQQKMINYSEIHQETPASSCSPDNVKTNLNCPNSNLSCEGSNSTESSSTPTVLEMGQEFYFNSSPPHRTGTSLLL